MRDTLRRLDVRRPVGHNDIFRRNKDRDLPREVGVVIDLLEGVTREAQAPQHPLMLRPVLDHLVGQLVVHVRSDTNGGLFLLWRFLTDNLGLYRTSSRERAHHGLGLELHQCFGQQRVVDSTRSRPRLGAVLDLQTKQLKAVHVSLNPVLTGASIFIKRAQ